MSALSDFKEKISSEKSENTAIAYASRINSIKPSPESPILQSDIDSFFAKNPLKQSTKRQTIAAVRAWNLFLGHDAPIRQVKMSFGFEKQSLAERQGFCFSSLKFKTHVSGCEQIELRDKALCAFLYLTGARINEAVCARFSDIDFNSKRIVISKQKSKQRAIPLNGELEEILLNYFDFTNEDPRQFQGGEDFLFRSQGRVNSGLPMTVHSARQNVQRILNDSGYPEYSPHIFRYAFVTNMFMLGAFIRDIQEISGHYSYGDLNHYFIGNKTGYDAVMEMKIKKTGEINE